MQESYHMELSNLEEKVNDVDDKVSSILTLLKGNDLNREDKGVIGIVNDLEERVATLEKWKDRIVWMFIGMGVPASVGVIEILRKLLIK